MKMVFEANHQNMLKIPTLSKLRFMFQSFIRIMCRTIKLTEKQLKKILIPLDGSKSSFRALDMGISVASKYKSTITAIYIHDLPVMLDYAVIDPVGKRDVSTGKKILEKAKKRVGKKSKFQSKIISGNVAEKILEFSGKKFDIIIMGHRGLSSSKELFLGSVSHHILQKSKLPVLVVR